MSGSRGANSVSQNWRRFSHIKKSASGQNWRSVETKNDQVTNMTAFTMNDTKLNPKMKVRKTPRLNPNDGADRERMRRLNAQGRAFYAGDFFVSSGRYVYAKGPDGGYGVLVGPVKKVWPEVYK